MDLLDAGRTLVYNGTIPGGQGKTGLVCVQVPATCWVMLRSAQDSDTPSRTYPFGSGMHTCFGKHIGTIMIPAVAKQLLKKQDLRRVEGPRGRLRYDGAFPDSMFGSYTG